VAERDRGSSVPVEGSQASARLAALARRAARAKVGIAAAGGIVFLAAAVLSRGSYASHAKHHARPLAAPSRFVGIVRQNLLQSGVVAPAQAPPEAQTSVS
jgi:hypothetical protein